MRLPRDFPPRSVRARTTLGAALALTGIVLLSGIVIERLIVSQIRSAADTTLTEQARDRAGLLTTGADPGELVNVIGDEVLAAVIGPDGTVLASNGTPDPESLASLPPGISTVEIVLIEGHHGQGEGTEQGHVEEIRTAVVQIEDGSRVAVGNEGEGSKATINVVRLILLLGGPLAAASGAAMAWLLTGQALAPVYRLRDDLEGVTRVGGRVVEPDTADEIQSLAATMNEVLARLDRQSAARRRFVADASHELKSPIANARILLETGERMDQAELRRRVGSELDRLQSLVDDLLFLARTDETTTPNPAEFDLDDVLFDEAERVAIRTEVAVDASGVQPAQVIADRAEVARAVRNLLENAVHHATAKVSVSVEQQGGSWLIAVTDDGPGIAEVDRSRIFERFTRLDHNRARAEGGTGLGLSIVASIANRNGGGVNVTDGPMGGARFELALPRATAIRSDSGAVGGDGEDLELG